MVLKASRGSAGIGFNAAYFLLDSGARFWHDRAMSEAFQIQGRSVVAADIARIRTLIVENPAWSRRRLSEAVAAEWDWRNGSGRLKDMAARSLLLKLEARGWIELPARRQEPSNRMKVRRVVDLDWDESAITGTLADLGPLTVREGCSGSTIKLAE